MDSKDFIVKKYELKLKHYVNTILFSPPDPELNNTSRYVAVAVNDKEVHVYSAQKKFKIVAVLPGHQHSLILPLPLAWTRHVTSSSPSSFFLACADSKQRILFYDATEKFRKDGNPCEFDEDSESGAIFNIDFSDTIGVNALCHLAVPCKRRKVVIFDVNTRKKVQTLSLKKEAYCSVFSPCQRFLAVAVNEGYFFIYSTPIYHQEEATSLSTSPSTASAAAAASSSSNNNNSNKYEKLHKIVGAHTMYIHSIAWNSSNNISTNNNTQYFSTSGADQLLIIWKVNNKECKKVKTISGSDQVYHAAWSHDNSYIVVGGWNNQCNCYSLREATLGKRLFSLDKLTAVRLPRISPACAIRGGDSKYLALGDWKGNLLFVTNPLSKSRWYSRRPCLLLREHGRGALGAKAFQIFNVMALTALFVPYLAELPGEQTDFKLEQENVSSGVYINVRGSNSSSCSTDTDSDSY